MNHVLEVTKEELWALEKLVEAGAKKLGRQAFLSAHILLAKIGQAPHAPAKVEPKPDSATSEAAKAA